MHWLVSICCRVQATGTSWPLTAIVRPFGNPPSPSGCPHWSEKRNTPSLIITCWQLADNHLVWTLPRLGWGLALMRCINGGVHHSGKQYLMQHWGQTQEWDPAGNNVPTGNGSTPPQTRIGHAHRRMPPPP